jgi:transcriptional regulator with XRE-family HTH domain
VKGEQKMYDIFERLMKEKGVTRYKVSKDTGISQSTLSDWKRKRSTPKIDKLQILADYFGVTVDYLTGSNLEKNNDQKEKPTLNEKDERDIKVKIDGIINMMSNQQGLMFDGNPLTPEALESIRNAMELGMAAAKLKNKQKHNK